MIRRVLRRLSDPLVTLVAAIVLYFSAATLPGLPAMSNAAMWWRFHAPHPWIEAIPTDIGWMTTQRIAELFVVREDDGWRIIDPDKDSFDELGGLITSGDREVVFVMVLMIDQRQTGAWAITQEANGPQMRLARLAADSAVLSRDDELAIRGVIADSLSDYPWIDSVRTSDAVTTRVVWRGYLHNGVTIAALVVFLLSLGWTRRVPARLRAFRARRKLRRGVCIACGYSFGGLAVCPECGLEREAMERVAGKHTP